MPDVKIKRLGVPDLLRSLKGNGGFQWYKDAKEDGRSLSNYLEDVIEVDSKDRDAGVDAYTLLVAEAGVITRSVPEEGLYASTVQEFVEGLGRTMLIEWGWRTYRRAQGDVRKATQELKRAFESGDFAPGTAMNPYIDDTTINADDFQPAIPVNEVLAASRGIAGNAFRGLYLTEPTAAQKRFVRIGERAEIPKVQIQVGEHTIDMYKYGRGIEMTYEVLRRETMDRLGTFVQLIAVQNEIDKLATIIDVMINGDGNANTAATNYNLSTLDTSLTGGDPPTPRAWYSFRSKWKNPYSMTHVLVREAASIDLQLMNTGSANLPMSLLPGGLGLAPQLRPINRNLQQTVGLGETDDAPASKWLGFDRRAAVERFFEIGGDIEETERYASNQTETVYFTEVEGYMVRNRNGVKTADLAA